MGVHHAQTETVLTLHTVKDIAGDEVDVEPLHVQVGKEGPPPPFDLVRHVRQRSLILSCSTQVFKLPLTMVDGKLCGKAQASTCIPRPLNDSAKS